MLLRLFASCLLLLSLVPGIRSAVSEEAAAATPEGAVAADAPDTAPPFPSPERLTYGVEWRFVTAGNIQVQLTRVTPATWETRLNVSSAGIVNNLYNVRDEYSARMDSAFCAATSTFNAVEGKRHRITTLNFDSTARKVRYEERDLVKNTVASQVVEVPSCTHEVTGAFAWIRTQPLEPGKSLIVPMTDGKRFAAVRVEAQRRETITVNGAKYQTIRYQAFLFDNVLYRHKGTLQLWLTDDAERLPVQIRLGLGFPVYNILLTLEKREKL
jgi:hypothetical protein